MKGKVIVLLLTTSFLMACSSEKKEKEVIQKNTVISTIEETKEGQTITEESNNVSEESTSLKSELINNLKIPKSNLTNQELEIYLGRLFLEIARYPDTIDDYEKVFDKESLQLLKEQEWYYADSAEFYDWVVGGIDDVQDNIYNKERIKGSTGVDNHNDMWDLELEKMLKREDVNDKEYKEMQKAGITGKWAFSVDWIYEKKSGRVLIRNCYFYMSYYGNSETKEGKVYPFP